MNNKQIGKILNAKFILICIVLIIFSLISFSNLEIFDLLEYAPPKVIDYIKTLYDFDTNRFGLLYYVISFFSIRIIPFAVMIIIFILSNLTFKYRIRLSVWKNFKWFIIIPASLLVLEVIAMLTLRVTEFVSISIVGWYIILNTIFEPIPMFKKKSKQTPISSNS